MTIEFSAVSIQVKRDPRIGSSWLDAFPRQGLGLAIEAITRQAWLFTLIKEEVPCAQWYRWRVSCKNVGYQLVMDQKGKMVRYLKVPNEQLPNETQLWTEFAKKYDIGCIILPTDWIPEIPVPTTIYEQAAVDEVLELENYLRAPEFSDPQLEDLMLQKIEQIERLPGYSCAMTATLQIKDNWGQPGIETLDRQVILDELNQFYLQNQIDRSEEEFCLKIRQVWAAFLPAALDRQTQQRLVQVEAPHNSVQSKESKAQNDRAWIVQTEAACHQWMQQVWSCLAWMQRYCPHSPKPYRLPVHALSVLILNTIQGIPNVAQRRYLEMYTSTMMKRIFGNLQILDAQVASDQHQEEEPAYSSESASS